MELEAAYPVVVSDRLAAWGQRRFGVRDPAGVWVDVVEQNDPAPGFWDQCSAPAAG
jgi:hypothetical protein